MKPGAEADPIEKASGEPGNKAKVYRGHFYSLDVLRGLAALGVVFWHWQHFFFIGTTPPNLDLLAPHEPLFILFRPLYEAGWRAVDLFFCLSGFIFFWLYSERVSRRDVSLKAFVVLRFSRLYPLHFATLLFVAVGQMLMLRFFGAYFVIPTNDLYHFILQLFFASSWGVHQGNSFNATTWSISIEVMLYAIFFTLCFFRCNRWRHLVMCFCVGLILMQLGFASWSRGICSFFIGGLSYRIFLHFWQRGISRSIVLGAIAVTTLLWMVIPLCFGDNLLYRLYEITSLRQSLVIAGKDVVGHYLLIIPDDTFNMILFPMTILTLALCEAVRGTLGKRLAFVGNISYSAYLIQFPLQMVFAFVTLALSIPNTIYDSPWVLFLFFSLLISLSLCSYSCFERPSQEFLRAAFLDRAPTPLPAREEAALTS